MKGPDEPDPSKSVSHLVVASLTHDFICSGLCSGQCIFNRLGTCQRGRHFLTHDHTDLRELRDGNELDTNIWLQISCTWSGTVENLIGTQFHPEKSQETGLRLISNFLSWSP